MIQQKQTGSRKNLDQKIAIERGGNWLTEPYCAIQ